MQTNRNFIAPGVGETAHAKTVRFVVDAFSIGDHGCEGPEFAVIAGDQDFLDRAKKLIDVCSENGMTEGRVYGAPLWAGRDPNNILSNDCEMAVSAEGDIWFITCPEFGDPDSTRPLNLAVAAATFQAADDGATVFISYNEEGLRDIYERLTLARRGAETPCG